MRLTLRTLLAWLDDTLPPAEVRAIGQQVAESQFALELVERTQRVSRQRRLTVPSSTGPDPTDPNVVAAYLDNELDAEHVAEYEKKCLTSDVHLAEVASVHQILSLIGQKAKVPPEARHRMYRLVKGRESVAAPVAAARPEPEMATHRAPALAARPAPKRVEVRPARPPARPWIERYGSAVVATALVGLLGWTAWMSTRPGPGLRPDPQTAPAIAEAAPGKPAAPAVGAPPKPVLVPPKPAVEPTPEPPTEPVSEATVPTVSEADGVLLRSNDEAKDWARLASGATLRAGDRLVNLAPTRSALVIGPVRLDLVGQAEATLQPPAGGELARVELIQGQLIARFSAEPATLGLMAHGRSFKIKASGPAVVGIELRPRQGAGSAAGREVALVVAEGDVAIGLGGPDVTVSGPKLVRIADAVEPFDGPIPPWLAGAEGSPLEKQLGATLAGYFKPGRPILTGLVEAIEDEQVEVRRLAIGALGLLGDFALIMPELGRPDSPATRRAALGVLRSRIAQGPAGAADVRAKLDEYFQPTVGGAIATLLVGFSAEEARSDATYARLVQDLKAPDLAVRELAIDNLRTLTGRDNLEYDPDKPEGKGLKAWQDLLTQKKLVPSS